MKNPPLLLLGLVCLLLAACQAHRRESADRAVATLNVMNQVAAVDIAHERNGDPPPRRYATWLAYWQHHFSTLRFTPASRDRGNEGMRNIASLHLAFVRQKRAEAGLPPFD